MELRDYLRIIRRRWMLIVTTFLLVVIAAAAVTFQTTPQYQSSTDLFVSTSANDVSEAYQGGTFSAQRVSSYADVATSVATASMVGGELGIDETGRGRSRPRSRRRCCRRR